MRRNSSAKRKLTSDNEQEYYASEADSEPKKTTNSKVSTPYNIVIAFTLTQLTVLAILNH
ncbi:hypothetical protein BS17DRAFT_463865 [Gyrodon lividus]|nr:hypothetical protein BS17DRAFT_463865 [Gyrodon lividus]